MREPRPSSDQQSKFIVELKAKTAVHPVHKAQLLSHLRLAKKDVGLLINFHEVKLIDGVSRIVNDYQGG